MVPVTNFEGLYREKNSAGIIPVPVHGNERIELIK